MNKHEAKIREIAEEMAAKSHPISFQLYNKYKDQVDNGWSHDFYVKNWPIIVESHVINARVAVKYMADTAERAYMIGRSYDNPYDRVGLKVMLMDYGLIPPAETGKEAGNDDNIKC